MERIINRRLTDWAEDKNIFMNEQSGFRNNHSTQDVIFKLIESSKINLKKIKKTGIVLFDLEKAFDTTPHNHLLDKLHKLKCPPLIGKWLLSYLKNRKFVVQINNLNSSVKNISAGIPQGGCLSAFLFTIFINDVKKELNKSKTKFAAFADDLSV